MKDQFWPWGCWFRENDLCKSNFDPGVGKEEAKDSLENQSKARIFQMEDHREDWSITNCAFSLNKVFIIIIIQFWRFFNILSIWTQKIYLVTPRTRPILILRVFRLQRYFAYILHKRKTVILQCLNKHLNIMNMFMKESLEH